MSIEEAPRESAARGTRVIRSAASLDGGAALHARVVNEIVLAVASMRGDAAAQALRSAGIEMLHTVIDANDIGPLRDRVIEALRPDLLRLAVTVGRSVMGWTGEFYVDDYLILRVNLPYEIARRADPASENPGIGRVTPSVRALAASRRVKDPVYDPRGYHGDSPPAAWAHGPHVDSWSGHSRDGLNVWWAVVDVPAEAGMVLYPQLAGAPLPCDPRTLYLRRGYPLPPPTFVPLQAGDMLIFDPEILHGTHLNVSGRTRVAVSLRLNASRPTFDPECFYAREFWRRASEISAHGLGDVLHLKREDNLAPRARAAACAESADVSTVWNAELREGVRVTVGPSSLVAEDARVIVAAPEHRVLLTRVHGKLFAVDAQCAHYGVELADGGRLGTTLHCPGCAVGFDLETGRSASACLALRMYHVAEDGGTILLEA